MMLRRLQALWNEPRAPDAVGPLRRDFVWVTVFAEAALLEWFLSDTLVWPAFSILLIVLLSLLLPWRRLHPLRTVIIAFSATGSVQLFSFFTDAHWSAPTASVVLLLLPYALARWASGRDQMLGLGVIALSFLTAVLSDDDISGAPELIGASLFLLFPAVLGAAVRYRDSANRRATHEVKLRERERLARELHDTVAHHVSAIAIQAQAGQVLAHSRPDATLDALAVIEEEASRTLADMRLIVGALRHDGNAPLAPAGTLADIGQLGKTGEQWGKAGLTPFPVNVTFSGSLDGLGASLESTLYRVAQEAMTNAFRHAEDAHYVNISVTGGSERVHLQVSNDGRQVSQPSLEGFGIPGMRERVSLLGGTLYAGPKTDGGWQVDAWLPARISRETPP